MNYLFISTQTGGLSDQINPILQIATVVTDNNYEIIYEWDSYVKPFTASIIEPEAIAINGITPDKYNGGITEGAVLNKLNQIIEEYYFPSIVCWNVKFDMGFLDAAVNRTGINLIYTGYLEDISAKIRFYTGSYRRALRSMADEFGVSSDNTNNSLEKCKVVINLAKAALLEGKARRR